MINRDCIICGTTFAPRRAGKPQVTCSTDCQRRLKIQRVIASQRLRKKPSAPKPPCAVCAKRIERPLARLFCSAECCSQFHEAKARVQHSAKEIEHECVVCGLNFTSRPGAMTCSIECRAAKNRQVSRAFQKAKSSRRRCPECSGPIRRGARICSNVCRTVRKRRKGRDYIKSLSPEKKRARNKQRYKAQRRRQALGAAAVAALQELGVL